MAAMTRLRCDPKDGIPTPLMAEYYAQRAGSGLIITECSAWSQRGIGFPGAGHIFTQ
jgi:N-ethylmaleimide reductase